MDTEYTKGFRAGSAYEQERIIKLLDKWACGSAKCSCQWKWNEGNCYTREELIELIKGENK